MRGILKKTSIYHRKVNAFSRALVLEALKNNNGVRIKTAKELGLNRSTLQRLILEFDIDYPAPRIPWDGAPIADGSGPSPNDDPGT